MERRFAQIKIQDFRHGSITLVCKEYNAKARQDDRGTQSEVAGDAGSRMKAETVINPIFIIIKFMLFQFNHNYLYYL